MSAAGLTFLQIVNRVLSRLREATVAANGETTYSTFVGTIVNQVKAEIEAAYHWQSLREIITVTTSAADTQYTLTGSSSDAVIIDAWNTTTNQRLKRGTNGQFNEFFYGASSVQTGSATHFMAAGLDSSTYDLQIDIWPSPASAETLKFEVYSPQADLSADATVALVPQSVLIEEVVARCLNERGDDTAPKPAPGETFIMKDLLASAVSRESAQDDFEMDWEAE